MTSSANFTAEYNHIHDINGQDGGFYLKIYNRSMGVYFTILIKLVDELI